MPAAPAGTATAPNDAIMRAGKEVPLFFLDLRYLFFMVVGFDSVVMLFVAGEVGPPGLANSILDLSRVFNIS